MEELCRVKYSEVESWYSYVESSRVTLAMVELYRVQ